MIGSELHLKAILCLPFGTHHNSGVVYQYIDSRDCFRYLFSELTDRRQRSQVQFEKDQICVRVLQFDVVDGVLSLFRITTSDDYLNSNKILRKINSDNYCSNFGSSSRQLRSGLFADSSISTSNDDHFAIESDTAFTPPLQTEYVFGHFGHETG